jgi:transposase InsO family protein
VTVKYGFIHGEEGNYPTAKMCTWSKVSASGYYEWKTRTASGAVSATRRRRDELRALVRWSFDRSDSTYGYRRVHADLARRGVHVDDDTVRQIMRDLDLTPCQPRPWRPVTTTAGDTSTTADLVRRDFTATTPGTKLVGDITYVATWQGWLYLATVLDCATKQVVGYATADHMRTSLVTDALDMAANRITIQPGHTIFHSDRGCQYTSTEFAAHTDALGIRRSLGRNGTCYDNAWAESFNGTIKVERIHRTTYPTREHARIDITRYIELRYNSNRLHSALGYRTPDEAEHDWHKQNTAA